MDVNGDDDCCPDRSHKTNHKSRCTVKGTEQLITHTPVNHDQSQQNREVDQTQTVLCQLHTVKSSSDTTIYSPGLRKVSNEDVSLIERISNFVEGIMLDGKNRVSRHVREDSKSMYRILVRKLFKMHRVVVRMYRDMYTQRLMQMTKCSHHKHIADQLIVQVEKFKARIEAAKGNNCNYSDMLMPDDYEKLKTKCVKPDGLVPLDY